MTSLLTHGLAPITLAAGLCACAAPTAAGWSEQLRADGWKAGASVMSIPEFRIDGFKALDDSHLVIYGGPNRRHLVTFGTACAGLRFAQRLAYTAPGGTLGRLDRLTVIGEGQQVDCVIDSIQPLEKASG